MYRTAGLLALALALALPLTPGEAHAQLVVRDDSDGWGWLTVVTDRRAIVQLAYASGSDDQGRLDAQLLENLRGRGVRRVFDYSSFDPAESQVLIECTGTSWASEGGQTQIAIHGEISYWDHTRLAATEIYEAISVGSAAQAQFSNEAYVQGCSRLVLGTLVKLGFDQG